MAMKFSIDRFLDATMYLIDVDGEVVASQPCKIEVKVGPFSTEIELLESVRFPAVVGKTIMKVGYRYNATIRHCATTPTNITPNGGDITIYHETEN